MMGWLKWVFILAACVLAVPLRDNVFFIETYNQKTGEPVGFVTVRIHADTIDGIRTFNLYTLAGGRAKVPNDPELFEPIVMLFKVGYHVLLTVERLYPVPGGVTLMYYLQPVAPKAAAAY